METGFLPALDEGQADMFSPAELRLYQHAQDHRLPWLNPDTKNYPTFRCTVEVQRRVTRPAAAARQPNAEMNEKYGMSTFEGISQDNSV